MKATKTQLLIDKAIIENADSGHRNHLGASIIGDSCSRKLWYTFRWAKKMKHPAQLHRLWDRGHKEEDRIVKWLRDAGITVWEVDENGNQFRVSGSHGHFGGSSDGVGLGIPDLPEGIYVLLEFKTHNYKSFAKLKKEGMVKSKPQHHVQMQVYMFLMGLPYGLYVAMNKNDDHMYTEIVKLDEDLARMYLSRADRIIFETEAPPRIKDDPTWFECGWCDFKYICHHQAPADVNCRTCEKCTPVDDGKWSCKLNQEVEQLKHAGCSNHKYFPDMVGGYNQMATEDSKELRSRLLDLHILGD